MICRIRPIAIDVTVEEDSLNLPATKASRHPARTLLSSTLHAIVTSSVHGVSDAFGV
jgi:hypothetical protein